MNRNIVFASLFLSAALNGFALSATDDASAYGSSWSNGSNFGSGFGAWDLSDNNNDGSTIFAGAFIGDSTAGAGNINTGTNQSFGLYANPGTAYMNATRSFSSSLVANDRFTAKLALNYNNGNKGLVLRSGTDEVVGFNVGNTTEMNTDFTNNATTAVTYDYGGDDAMIDVVIQVINSTSLSYQISRTSGSGTQGILYSGTVTGITAAIDNVKFYVSGTDNGDPQNNLYFNSLEVVNVPEPAQSVLALAILSLLAVGIRRRRPAPQV